VISFLKIPNKIIRKVVVRAIERKKPCSINGTGIRDAIIWFSLLDYMRENNKENIAFISRNIKDFSDGKNDYQLNSTLIKDTNEFGVNVLYYTSLREFLKEYAKPISHINRKWLIKRICIAEVKTLAENAISLINPLNFFDIVDLSYRERFVPTTSPELSEINVKDLEDYYLWEFSKNKIEVSLTFELVIKGISVCKRVEQLKLFYDQADFDPNAEIKDLAVRAVIFVNISAKIEKDKVHLLRVEGIKNSKSIS
jgi:hypothetical protein